MLFLDQVVDVRNADLCRETRDRASRFTLRICES